jgi:purine catabolism regulatory family protein/PucR-like helix-turn-helix protein
MSITVGELLKLPHLRMRLLAGADGLDRAISWVHTSDLVDPWGWLGFGELLLTNGTGLSPDGAEQARFVARLAEAGASGLGIGLGMSGPPLTPELHRQADALRLPVVTVPYSMQFTTVVRAVADANTREEARQLGRVARLYELLRTSVLAGWPGPELFRRLGGELGARLYLVDPETGVSVFGDGVRTAFAGPLRAGYAAHGNAVPGVLRLAGSGPGTGGAVAVAVAVPGEQPAVLVAEPTGAQLPSPLLLHHIATGGALEIAQLAAAQEQQRKLGERLLGQLLDRRLDAESAQAQLSEHGLDLAGCVLAVARAEPAGAGPRTARGAASQVHRALARAAVSHLLAERDGLLQVVLPAEAVAARLLPECSRAIGVSGGVGAASRVPDAAHEARWALAAAEAEGKALVRFGEETALLLPRSAAEAQALVTRILGALLAHDAGHGTAYLDTLRALLEHDRSWQLAAAALHIHKQTLGYRIRKIEQLTGRGITRTEHLAEWWFALRAHDLLTGHHLR